MTPVFDPGLFLYRARPVSTTFNKENGIGRKDLIYPPKPRVRLGRLNRSEQPVFYTSMHKEPVFFENRDVKAGSELVLSFWKTAEKLIVNNIGYTEYVFRLFGAHRAVPRWEKPSDPNSNKDAISLPEFSAESVEKVLSEDECREIHEAFSKYFMKSVVSGDEHQYKLTTAIGELHLGDIKNLGTRFAGALYPSTRMWANGDNLALLPWFVDKHLEFRKALHVRIDAPTDTGFSVTYLDSARGFDDSGNLIWSGKPPHWSLDPGKEGKFTFVLALQL